MILINQAVKDGADPKLDFAISGRISLGLLLKHYPKKFRA